MERRNSTTKRRRDFFEFSPEADAVAIDILLYSMTH